jgi:hypothetical protein
LELSKKSQIGGDESVQDRIARKPDEVRDPFTLAILINLGLSKCRITPKPEKHKPIRQSG